MGLEPELENAMAGGDEVLINRNLLLLTNQNLFLFTNRNLFLLTDRNLFLEPPESVRYCLP